MALLVTVLVANFVFAAAAWLVGSAIERLGASANARLRVWVAGLVAAAVIVPGIVLVNVLPVPTPWATPVLERFARVGAAPGVISNAGLVSVAPSRVAPQISEPVAPFIAPFILALLAFGFAARLRGLLHRRRVLRRLVESAEPMTDRRLVDGVAAAAGRLSVRAPEIALSTTATPLVIRRPRLILLPRTLSESLPADRIVLICGHEIAHLKRGDDWAMAVEAVVLSIFWFNPLMGSIARRLSAAREEVCDEIALGEAGREVRQAYAETLISTFKLGAGGAAAPAFIGLQSNRARQRLLAILDPARPSAVKAGLAFAAAAILLVTAGGASLAFAAGDGSTQHRWLPPEPLGQDLTDADKAWLILRGQEIDLVDQERYYARIQKGIDRAQWRRFLDFQHAQIATIRTMIKDKPISAGARARGRRMERDGIAVHRALEAEDAHWDHAPARGQVRASVFCPVTQPCLVKAIAPATPAYSDWARRYAETFHGAVTETPSAFKDGLLFKVDFAPEMVAVPVEKLPRDFPTKTSMLTRFIGVGPEGIPMSVNPPPTD